MIAVIVLRLIRVASPILVWNRSVASPVYAFGQILVASQISDEQGLLYSFVSRTYKSLSSCLILSKKKPTMISDFFLIKFMFLIDRAPGRYIRISNTPTPLMQTTRDAYFRALLVT